MPSRDLIHYGVRIALWASMTPMTRTLHLGVQGIHVSLGQIWRITSANRDLTNPPWPPTRVPQRPRYWIPLPTIGELPAKWPVGMWIMGAGIYRETVLARSREVS